MDRLRFGRREIIDATAALVMCVIALVGFRSSYGGWEFFVVGIVGILIGLVLAHLLIAARLPTLVGAAAVAGVYVLLAGPVALRDRSTAGFLPNLDTVRSAAETAVRGWKELITTNPPVGSTGTLMALPFLCGLVSAVLTLVLMRHARRSVIALPPSALVLGVSVITGVVEPVSVLVQGSAYAVAILGWLAVRHHRVQPRLAGQRSHRPRVAMSAALLTAAAGLGWVVAPRLPMADAQERTVWRQTVTPPFDPRQYPSPLSGYREYLKNERLKEKVLFTVEGLPANTLIRLATMDAYDGLVWRPSYRDDQPTGLNSGYFERMGSEIESDFGGEVATVTITIGAYADVWIPDVGEVLSLRFEGGPRDRELNEALRYNRATDTAASPVPLAEGDRYVMTVRLPAAPADLAGEALMPDAFVPQAESVGEIDKWAATPSVLSIDDPGARIDLLAARMRDVGTYSDGDQTQQQQPARAGHSAFRMKQFIEGKSLVGNAEQYASAMALMLRGLDRVPTRVVMGFRSDDVVDGAMAITGSQVEAWVEVPVIGTGWVPVLATPDRSDTSLKASTASPPEPDYQTQVPGAPPLLEPEFDQPATSKAGAEDTTDEADETLAEDDDEQAKDDDGALAGSWLSGWVLVAGAVVGAPLLFLAGGIALIVGAKAIRRGRRRGEGRADVRIANGWLEMVDAAVDMGRPVPSTATRQEASRFVSTSTMVLARRADAAVFGPEELDEATAAAYWVDLERTLGSLRSELGIVGRIKAAMSITSFTSRRRAGSSTRRFRSKEAR